MKHGFDPLRDLNEQKTATPHRSLELPAKPCSLAIHRQA